VTTESDKKETGIKLYLGHEGRQSPHMIRFELVPVLVKKYRFQTFKPITIIATLMECFILEGKF
jgi:hypothetical protein